MFFLIFHGNFPQKLDWIGIKAIEHSYKTHWTLMKYMVRILTFGWKFWLSKNSWTDFLSIPLKGAIFMNFHCFWGAYLSFFSTWFRVLFQVGVPYEYNLAAKWRPNSFLQPDLAQFTMAIPFLTSSSGPISQLKCCVTESGEILWPVKSFFSVAFGDSQRQYLGVDKSKLSLGKLCCTIFGLAKAGPMEEL